MQKIVSKNINPLKCYGCLKFGKNRKNSVKILLPILSDFSSFFKNRILRSRRDFFKQSFAIDVYTNLRCNYNFYNYNLHLQQTALE